MPHDGKTAFWMDDKAVSIPHAHWAVHLLHFFKLVTASIHHSRIYVAQDSIFFLSFQSSLFKHVSQSQLELPCARCNISYEIQEDLFSMTWGKRLLQNMNIHFIWEEWEQQRHVSSSPPKPCGPCFNNKNILCNTIQSYFDILRISSFLNINKIYVEKGTDRHEEQINSGWFSLKIFVGFITPWFMETTKTNPVESWCMLSLHHSGRYLARGLCSGWQFSLWKNIPKLLSDP